MTTYNVTTADFASTLNSAVNGDILILADGNYGDFTRRRDWGHHQNTVTVQAANQYGAKFTTGYFKINSLTVDGVEFTGAPHFWNCNNVAWLNVKQGYSTINDDCDSITLKYCWFTGLQQIQSSGPSTVSTNVTYDCCCFKHTQSYYASPPTTAPNSGNDWLQIQNATDLTIKNCTFWDNYAYWDGVDTADAPHLDCIQVFVNGALPQRITIEDNWIWDTTETHASALDGQQGMNLSGRDYLVRGNIICTTHPNSTIFDDFAGGATGSIYEENLVIPGPTVAPYNTGSFYGGNIRCADDQGVGGIVRNSVCTSISNESNLYTVSGITTGVTGPNAFDWTNDGAVITDYVPNTSGAADVSQRWRTRLDAIIAGTADFYDPNGYNGDPVLYLANAEDSAPVITGTPSISGTENVGQVLTASSASVAGVPTPNRTWQWYNNTDGLVQDSTSNQYTLQASDQGDTLYVQQTETNYLGTDTEVSSNTGTIGAALSAPVAQVFSPADNATQVAVSATFSVQFDQNIAFGTGDIKLWRAGEARETWNVVTDPGGGYHDISITDDTLSFAPVNNMFEADYWITIDAGAIESAATGAAYPGFSDETTWNFSTIPTPTSGRFVLFGSHLLLTPSGLPLLTS